jgi:hypothetical protein
LLPGDLEEQAGRGSDHLALVLGLFVDQREILEFGSVALGLVGNL